MALKISGPKSGNGLWNSIVKFEETGTLGIKSGRVREIITLHQWMMLV